MIQTSNFFHSAVYVGVTNDLIEEYSFMVITSHDDVNNGVDKDFVIVIETFDLINNQVQYFS